MLGCVFLLLSLWIGFLIEDYIEFFENKTVWLRCACAITTGSMFATWIVFGLSFVFGFSKSALYAGMICMAAYAAYEHIRNGKNFLWFKKNVLQQKKISFVYIGLLLYVMPFFLFGLWETNTGDIVYRGNYTDFSYHLSIVSAFVEQTRFLPLDPQSAGNKMSYHFLVNFHSAILCKGGWNPFLSIIIPQILFSFALATMLYYFYLLVLKTETAVLFAAVLFMLGHIGFFNLVFAFFGHPTLQNMTFDPMSWISIKEQLLFPFFNFLNPIINYFHPQRPFLFSFPMALLVLSGIYSSFKQRDIAFKTFFLLAMFVGLMPLFHIHTFFILAPLVFLDALYLPWNFRQKLIALLPLTLSFWQIYLILSQPKVPGFSGFDVHKLGGGLVDLNILDSVFLTRAVFWLRAAGFPLILGIAGVVFMFYKKRWLSFQKQWDKEAIAFLFLLTIPFCFFILINFYRFSPNWGDSNKFFLFFNLMLCGFAGNMLSAWFKKQIGKPIVIFILVIAALGPSALEAYEIFSRPGTLLFSGCDKIVAEWIKLNTPQDSIFLTSDDVIHYVPSLSGRIVVDGAYTWNTGFKKPCVENDVKNIYLTGNRGLIKKYNISYILVGPHERRNFSINESALAQYKMVFNQSCGGNNVRIYDTRQKTSAVPEFIQWRKAPQKNDGMKPIYLSDIEPLIVTQTFDLLHYDRSVSNGILTLNNKQYEKGLGTHAYSEIIYELNGRFHRFASDVGLDDSQDGTPGSVVFKIYLDGQLRWESKVLKWNSKTEHVSIDITNAQDLKLVVEDAGDGDRCDHANWADAKLF